MTEGFVEEIKINYDEYYKIAEKTKCFNDEELSALDHALDSWYWGEDDEYRLVDVKEEGKIVGFSVFGRAPLSKFCWDIYWIVVKVNKQKNGYGKQLLKMVEDAISKDNKYSVLRIETSSRDIYAPARKLYESCGFKQGCVIENYFDAGDSLMVFFKHIGTII
jgi:ribosomal protein S18 acetylase RimI-like enzyme